MTQMQFMVPSSVEEAVKCLADQGERVKILAGGTDLLVQLRAGHVHPDTIVDIKQIPELREIHEEDGGFRVGAAVSGAELNEHKTFPKAWPGVAEGVNLIGSTQIQGRASLGGNLCNASPAADSVPAMIAAAASGAIVGRNGRRDAKVEEIITGPGQTSLAADEFILSFFFPARAARSGDAYLRLIPRTEMDIAVVGAGVSVSLDAQGKCTAARVALGAVAPTPVLVDAATEALIGTQIDASALENLSAAASAACAPIDDKRGTVEYRTKVAGVLARRAAEIAAARARKTP